MKVESKFEANRIIWHADIVREVERSLRLLGKTEAEIASLETTDSQAMYESLQKAGGTADVLGIIDSYRNTMPDGRVFELLRHWNDVYSDCNGRTNAAPWQSR